MKKILLLILLTVGACSIGYSPQQQPASRGYPQYNSYDQDRTQCGYEAQRGYGFDHYAYQRCMARRGHRA